jgi:hypothetical protein
MLDAPDLSDVPPLTGASLVWAITWVGLLGMLTVLA